MHEPVYLCYSLFYTMLCVILKNIYFKDHIVMKELHVLFVCLPAVLGSNKDCLKKKQLCHNNAATRMLSLCRKFDHITPVLTDLPWLPLGQRIEYKVLLLPIKLLMVKPLHTWLNCCIYTHKTCDCDQRTKIFSQSQDVIWKGSADAVLRMRLHRFGSLFHRSLQKQSEDLLV